ncbi:MAG TPA: hypothetical protein VFR03_14470 [Thermoanaerobaculia bacterium]|nr:hypothetical protein [Thermoanaerobaculia bacterium]
MPELIYEHSARVEDGEGTVYVPRTYGQARGDGTWIGWIEFHPEGGEGVFLRTDQETSQPNRAALAYWATGLEPVYFEGAFARAAELTER